MTVTGLDVARRAVLLAMLLALAAAAAWPAAAQEAPDRATYAILRDGSPIGRETYTFSEAPDGALTVRVETRTDVRVLFFAHRFRHSRTEIWRDGHLIAMTARSDADGTPHALAMRREDGGWRVEVDGRIRREPADVLPLTTWTSAVLKAGRLLSVVDGEAYAVSTETVGPDMVGDVSATRHEMTGDILRTLWYDDAGRLVKLRMTRAGSVIELLRQ